MALIGLSGKKGSGKSSACNYMHGVFMQFLKLTDQFIIDENGQLIVRTAEDAEGLIDLNNDNPEFIAFMRARLWPVIKKFACADTLKRFAMDMGLTKNQVYGTNEEKDSLTDYEWKQMPFCPKGKQGRMTGREFLEHWGTGVLRRLNAAYHINALISSLNSDGAAHKIVEDVRFPNEVEAIQKAGGVVIRFTRSPFESDADSENALNADVFDWAKFDYVVDNANMSMGECHDKLDEIMCKLDMIKIAPEEKE